MEFVALVGRFVLAGVFVLAALPKLRRPRAFRLTVARYQILPTRLVRPVARVIPVLEGACAFLLLVGIAVRPSAAVLAALLVAFTIAVGTNVALGRSFDCGCGGVAVSERIGWALVVRNAVLAVWAVAVSAVTAPVLSVAHQNSASALGGARALSGPLLAAFVLAAAGVVSAALRLRRALVGIRTARVAS